jgi:hypothetical protein
VEKVSCWGAYVYSGRFVYRGVVTLTPESETA